jgi:succinyl-CoA synthetase beta subunit
MLLSEYEGKCLLREVGVTASDGFLARSGDAVARGKLPYPVAVKAQVAAGSRGKAGGVVRAATPAAACSAARRILAMRFGEERPAAVLIEPWLTIKRELYLSVTIDQAAEGYVVLYAARGGIDIEQGKPPVRYDVGPARNFRAYRLREILRNIESDSSVREKVIALARRLVDLASARDCVTVEINPLAQLDDGSLVAADAKIVRDEYAAFRAADIAASISNARKQQPKPIARALAGDLMLVWLDGEVGLISGGAGMTMATMDLIAGAGGRPACFLDCSANPTPDGYRLAFDLLDREAQVKVILVSIFGGLTQMDRVARVMKDIAQQRSSRKPVVFRLNGTNAERVEAIFAGTKLRNHSTLESAVAEAVSIARKAGRK